MTAEGISFPSDYVFNLFKENATKADEFDHITHHWWHQMVI